MITVYVWIPELENVGHSSAKIIDDSNNRTTYVSWWPSSSDSIMKKRTGHFNTYENDVLWEGKNPEFTYELKGLDESSAIDWWEEFITNANSNYSLGMYNCSWAVIKALKAAGADSHFPWHRFLDKNNQKIKLPNPEDIITKYLESMLNLFIEKYKQTENKKVSIKTSLKRPIIDIIDEFSSVWSPRDVIKYVNLLTQSINGEDKLGNRVKEILTIDPFLRAGQI
jgi:hypothetical protein